MMSLRYPLSAELMKHIMYRLCDPNQAKREGLSAPSLSRETFYQFRFGFWLLDLPYPTLFA